MAQQADPMQVTIHVIENGYVVSKCNKAYAAYTLEEVYDLIASLVEGPCE
jgi:hypothetical protein